MVVVKLSGGLGNQMFQYAFGFILQQRFKIKVKYDFSFFLNKKSIHNYIMIDRVFNIGIGPPIVAIIL